MSSTYFRPLTGLRAVAALLVWLHHFSPSRLGVLLPGLWPVFDELHVGVSIFFTLSGFLIAHRYAGRIRWRRAFLVQYLGRRLARIYPLYLLLTVVALLFPDSPGGSARYRLLEAGLNLTLLRGFSAEFAFTGIAQGWSLTVEECFYLFALAYLWVQQRSFPARRPWLAVGSALGLLVVGLGLALLARRLELPVLQNPNFVLVYTFFGRSVEFLVGAGLALHLPPRPGVRPHPLYTYLGLAALALAVAALVGITALPDPRPALHHPAGLVVNHLLLPLAVATLLYGLITERTTVARLLASRPLQLLGASSYAFYLLHQGPLQVWLGRRLDAHTALGYPATVLLLWAAAVGLYRGVEQPLNRWLRARLPAAPEDQPRP
ncbi:acyltransferase [Hymenobacter gummosus]|uniref:Acyltransferase n=1 Tax=Hymenobacter gummosus TaxID=1776032 RepID=A0A3S0JCV6_9BACT|nr:acyltransferase [Hymenobacter gummosus]RTQ52461.1 acyltransferase [Hymenobacter gummosus]